MASVMMTMQTQAYTHKQSVSGESADQSFVISKQLR